MRAALDESFPESKAGIFYVVGAVVVVTDDAATKIELAKVLVHPNRKRPFHWVSEGPEARGRMLACLEKVGAIAHVSVQHPTGRKKTEAARANCLEDLLPRILDEGTTELVIESRGETQDGRDRKVILDVLRDLGMSGQLAYDHRPKDEPFLWLADAVCGAVRDYLLGLDASHHDRLRACGLLGEISYLSAPTPRNA